MWDCLVGFSTWAEDNSGQIQIVIAAIAFLLAIFGYLKILEQIKIANRQDNKAEKDRFYELKLNLIKAVNDESKYTQLLHDEFLNSVDMYFFCKQSFSTIKSKQLQEDIDSFYKEVLEGGRGMSHLDIIKKRKEFLDDTFVQINNQNLKTEHIERILNKIFESDLRFDQIKSDLNRMNHLIDAMKCFGVN